MAGVLRALGGRIETRCAIGEVHQLTGFDYVMFDTGPQLPLRLLGHRPPGRVRRATPTSLRRGGLQGRHSLRIAAIHVSTPRELQRSNPTYVGGDINCGALDLVNLIARPRLSLDPYWLGVDGHRLCSSSTPSGTGVHGMCGHLAALSALRRDGHAPRRR
ncbi:hypothetical protein [Nocardia sp. MH4]|uniref:hypothetical protein n=1 Tax=Nocardia sp. MH4 TaxID=1768677 RepID=UPI001C4F9A2A|nr:hypothetical protein [Nocardia sp. MH4]